MSAITQTILNKIKQYDKIAIFRHIRPDGDAMGSAMGLASIIRATYPEKSVYLQGADFSDILAFLGKGDAPLSDSELKDTLGIVVDTATKERISGDGYSACRELIKIDHHIPVDSYAGTEWVEEHRSSASEMIAAFYEAHMDELKLDTAGATHIYMGMVTDSGRFRFNSVSGDTHRLAGMLLDFGIDTDTLFARLYLRSPEAIRYEAYVRGKMCISDAGVASIFISRKLQKKMSLTREAAGEALLALEDIKGSLIWAAFIECEGEIRIRLRSRFVAVNKLAEKYSGGGHAHACGAKVHSRREMKEFLKDAEALLVKFKSENPDAL